MVFDMSPNEKNEITANALFSLHKKVHGHWFRPIVWRYEENHNFFESKSHLTFVESFTLNIMYMESNLSHDKT